MTNLIDRLAAAPISWGICEVPDWGEQLPVDRVLAEMRDLGFTTTELGAAGYLPEEPAALSATLASYDLSLLGAFIPLVVHDPAELDRCWKEAEEAADLLVGANATYFITAPVLTWDWATGIEVSDAEWAQAYAVLDRIEDMCNERGLRQAVHPHLGTLLELDHQVQRVLDNTRASFTLDTGHLMIGGYDPRDFVHNHFDRISHVHLKDVVFELSAPVLAGDESIMQGVQKGMFCNLGSGDIPLAEVIEMLADRSFDGWYVIEQDAAIVGETPGPGAGPGEDVRRSIDFLKGLGTADSDLQTQTHGGENL